MRTRGSRTSGPRRDQSYRLIGRDAELQRLTAAISQAAGGDPGVVVLSAAPGMGKSRLAAEALQLAADAGFATFLGHAGDLSSGIAYAPFVEAFGARLRDATTDDRRELLRGLNQLGLVIGGLDVREPYPLGDPILEKARIVDGFARLVERCARRGPVALVLEDVHTVDSESIALLRHLALTIDDKPLLLILTIRSNEPAGEQFTRLLTEMSSAGWWQDQLELFALNDNDSALLLSEIIGDLGNAELIKRIQERCEGVPRFLESIASDLRDGGIPSSESESFPLNGKPMDLPTDIRERVALRLSTLTAVERRIVELIALSGARSEYTLLTAGGDSERLVSETLEHLEERMLVTTSADGTLALAHGILQEVVVGDMAPALKRRRHAELARALQSQSNEDPRIAEHLIGAGSLIEPDDAIAALSAAAKRVSDLGAHDDALRYLTAALEFSTEEATAARAGILSELGRICVLSGHRDEAVQYWKRALADYRRLGDPHGRTRANRELAQFAWGDGNRGSASDYFDAAERAQEGLEPTRELAELLYSRMTLATRDGDASTVAELSRRLRLVTLRLHAPDIRIRFLLAEAARELTLRNLRVADEKNTEALELATANSDLTLEMRAHDQLSVAASIAGDIARLRRHSEASLEAVAEIGAVNLRPWPRMRLAMADLLTGDWDRALRTSADVMATVEGFGDQRGQLSALGTYAWLLVLRGRLREADDALSLTRAQLATRPPIALSTAATALALARGRYDEAARLGAPLEELAGSWYPFPSAMLLGESLARTAPPKAAELAHRIREWSGRGSIFPDAAANFIDGLWDHGSRGAGALSESITAFDSLGFPFLAARSRLALAARPDGDATDSALDSIRLATDALTAFDSLGAPLYAREARELLRSLGVIPSRGRAPTNSGSELSKRELEVSRLVASGYSNAHIATELFISPRTVTTHLDHIYHKLELSSRTALTRYLADSGLLTEASDDTRPREASAAHLAGASPRIT